MIAGPTTVVTTVGKMLNGNMALGAGGVFNLATQCLTDTFSVTGPSGSVPPVICGTNTGEHSEFRWPYIYMPHKYKFCLKITINSAVYVDISDACNSLTFEMGQLGVGTTIPSRAWSIKAITFPTFCLLIVDESDSNC